MMDGIVRYWDVGRNKVKGEFEFKDCPAGCVETLVEKKVSKYLLSSEIEAVDGTIFVGGYRPVGKYSVDVKQ